MSENVSWPKASEGGRVVGKEEIRAYWTRQWKEFDPHVEPVEVIDREGGKTDVRVHQLVKTLGGDVLSDTDVWHVYPRVLLGSDDFPTEAKVAATRDLNNALQSGWPGFEIAESIPLAEIARAHELVEHPVRRGRVVVTA